MTKSAFEAWFVEQFGRRNGDNPYSHVNDWELGRRVRVGQDAQEYLSLRREWDRKHDAALEAWCAHVGRE